MNHQGRPRIDEVSKQRVNFIQQRTDIFLGTSQHQTPIDR